MEKLNKLVILLAFIGLQIGTLNAQITILDQSLLTQQSFNSFTVVSVTGNQVWNFSQEYGAVCSGFFGGQSVANEDWLISPVMDLSAMDNVKLTFSHTRGNAAVMNVGVAQGWYKAFATDNYNGNPATTEWFELEGLNQNMTDAWQYISSGQLTIPDGAKSVSSRIAFRYISSNSQSATWEIKDVKVKGLPQGTNPGSNTVFKITNWNTEWLGCTSFGPENETLQINNVAAAMLSMNSDVYCIQEVTNTPSHPSIDQIIAIMGAGQWAGAIVPSNTGDCNQRQAIIYKKSKVQFVSASEMSSGNGAQGNSYNYNWSGGRFPALYNVTFIAGTNSIPVSIVNIHAKAEDNIASSYMRRKGGSEALKTILDGATYNTKNLIIVGDFNDYLVGTTSTTCQCSTSPFKNFMDDHADYSGITSTLIDVDTNFGTHPIIENIIISNELTDNYIANSAEQEEVVAETINSYYYNTSNHLPVSAYFQFEGVAGIEDIAVANTWTVYPNPVKDILYIDYSGATDETTAIYDITGRQIAFEKSGSNTLNVSALPSGMYIIKMGNSSKKFVKE